MGISQFPAAAGGGGLSNDFILDKADTVNTTFTLPREFEAGGYSITTSTGDTSYDVYFLNASGSAVGYSNSGAIVASEAFAEVVVLGIGTAETVSFAYNGPSVDATAAGNEPGAGPYLTSISPSDLPQIDDTAILAGGNFAANMEVAFISGTVVKAAKNLVIGSSTAAVVTRPDDLIEDLAPYDVRAINPDVDSPTGSNVNILTGTVTAGTDPSFVTTSPILGAFPASAFSSAILTSDTEGTVVSWAVTAGTVPTGLTLGTADGSLAGTPTVAGNYNFTVEITDDGGNTNSAAFDMPVGLSVLGGNSTVVGGTTYVYFTESDDAVITNAGSTPVEYLIIAGGGGGSGTSGSYESPGGGGGAGGLLFGTATPATDGTATVVVGSGGAGQRTVNGTNGVNSSVSIFGTAIGGGGGAYGEQNDPGQTGSSGGSGGGGGGSLNSGGTGGTGTAGQGNNGGNASGRNYTTGYSGGGGGAGEAGNTDGNGQGGDGLDYGAWATAIGIVYDGGFFAGGGGGNYNGTQYDEQVGGDGGGGRGGKNRAGAVGSANSGGGGGGSYFQGGAVLGGSGGSGLVVLRF